VSVPMSRANRVAGALSFAGGAIVATGTFLTWFHLEGQTSGPRFSFGFFTIYQLGDFNAGFWYSVAGAVILFGAVLLVSAGVALFGLLSGNQFTMWPPIVMAVGTLVVFAGALGTGLPHWLSQEPLWWTRGPGEMICLWGAGVGFLALLVEVSSRVLDARTVLIWSHEIGEKVPTGA
jgi:hypothetical protein